MSWTAKLTDITRRTLATFAASALAIIGGAALLGDIPVWKSAAIAGFVAVVQAVEKIAKASIDGSLTEDEIDAAFDDEV